MLKKHKTNTSAKNNAEVIFYEKRQKKPTTKKDDMDNTKEIIDLRKFFHPEMVQLDDNGSYTGITKETYYDGIMEEPVQDADDL